MQNELEDKKKDAPKDSSDESVEACLRIKYTLDLTNDEMVACIKEGKERYNKMIKTFFNLLDSFKKIKVDFDKLVDEPADYYALEQQQNAVDSGSMQLEPLVSNEAQKIAQNLVTQKKKDENEKLPEITGASLLHLAVQANPNGKLVNYLLETLSLNINQKTHYGVSALVMLIHTCTETTNTKKILNLLIKKGSDINLRTNENDTPILMSSISNKMGFLELLMNTKGANPNVENNKKETPLIHFAKNRNLQGCISLLENNGSKADPNYLDSDKRSALHWAINNSSTSSDASYELEELLLKHGCNVNQIDERGRTPLHYAFVKVGKPFNFSEIDPIEVVANLISREDCSTDIVDNYGNTPLCYAAQKGSVISTLALIRGGARMNHKNKDGNTPLGISLLTGHQNNAIFLIQKEADVTGLVNMIDYKKLETELIKKEPEKEEESNQNTNTFNFGGGLFGQPARAFATPAFGTRYKPPTKSNSNKISKDKSEKKEFTYDMYLKRCQNLEEAEKDFDIELKGLYYEENKKQKNNNHFGNRHMFGRQQQNEPAVNINIYKDNEAQATMFAIAIRRNWQSVAYLLLQFGFDSGHAILDSFDNQNYNYV